MEGTDVQTTTAPPEVSDPVLKAWINRIWRVQFNRNRKNPINTFVFWLVEIKVETGS